MLLLFGCSVCITIELMTSVISPYAPDVLPLVVREYILMKDFKFQGWSFDLNLLGIV